MRKLVFHLSAILILFCLLLPGCSGSKKPDQAKEDTKNSTVQAVDAVKELRKPIEKARAAQQLGDERVNAIDDAVNQK